MGEVVIDTNGVLDLWVFEDAGLLGLRHALVQGRLCWRATPGMRDELARVLGYPPIVRRLTALARPPGQVLDAFDRWSRTCAPAPAAPVRCRDPDDQPFIDLAVQWRATLFSKDACVTALARHLVPHGVRVLRHWPEGGATV